LHEKQHGNIRARVSEVNDAKWDQPQQTSRMPETQRAVSTPGLEVVCQTSP
jgi:hypothetical protein